MFIENISALLLLMLIVNTSSALNVVELNTTSPFNDLYDYELHIFDDLYVKLLEKFKKQIVNDTKARFFKTHAFGQYMIRPPFNPNITFDVDCGRGYYFDLYTIERATPPYIHSVHDGNFTVSMLFNFSDSALSIPFFNFTSSRNNEIYEHYVVFLFDPVLLRVTTAVTLRPVRSANVTAVEFPCFEFSSSVIGLEMDKKLKTYRRELTKPILKQFLHWYKPQIAANLFEEFKKDIKLIYFDYYKK